jgi:hypothetical protein
MKAVAANARWYTNVNILRQNNHTIATAGVDGGSECRQRTSQHGNNRRQKAIQPARCRKVPHNAA